MAGGKYYATKAKTIVVKAKPKRKAVTKKEVSKLIMNNGMLKAPKIVKETCHCFNTTTSVSSQVGVITYGALTFILADIPNYAEYVNLYDEYMINKIVVTFHSRSFNGSSAIVYRNFLHTVIDMDDGVAPTTVEQLLEYDTHKFTLSDKSVKRTLVPSVAAAYYKSAVATAYGTRQNAWLDLADTAVPHYGLKYALTNSANASEYSYLITCVYYCSFRSRR